MSAASVSRGASVSGSAVRTHAATASRSRPSPSGPGAAASARTDSTRVAVSDVPPRSGGSASRATAKRGSRSAGTGPALPDVVSVDDSRCFDLSGDSPATDASSMRRTHRVRHPNREIARPRQHHAVLSEPCTSVLGAGPPDAVDENDIPTGSTTNRSRTLDRPM